MLQFIALRPRQIPARERMDNAIICRASAGASRAAPPGNAAIRPRGCIEAARAGALRVDSYRAAAATRGEGGGFVKRGFESR